MEYYLTSKLVCPLPTKKGNKTVNHMPILRVDFEDWLYYSYPLDFPNKNLEGTMLIFWKGDLAGCDPAEKVAEYVRIFEEQTEWDTIRNKTAAIVASHRIK